MINFFLFLLNFIIISNIFALDNKELMFKKELSRWKINYDTLELNKAGATCNPFEDKIEAIGFSYQIYDIDFAKKIALDGGEKMKKKNKILSDCKCEIIIINDNFVGEKKIEK